MRGTNGGACAPDQSHVPWALGAARPLGFRFRFALPGCYFRSLALPPLPSGPPVARTTGRLAFASVRFGSLPVSPRSRFLAPLRI